MSRLHLHCRLHHYSLYLRTRTNKFTSSQAATKEQRTSVHLLKFLSTTSKECKGTAKVNLGTQTGSMTIPIFECLEGNDSQHGCTYTHTSPAEKKREGKESRRERQEKRELNNTMCCYFCSTFCFTLSPSSTSN